jgi:hypothetical protein
MASMAPRSIGSLPLPSPALAFQELPVFRLRKPLFRVHDTDHEPAFWGKTGNNRFDAPAAEFGVLYAATDQHGAFIETCFEANARTATAASLTRRGWARVEPRCDLRLIDLSGAGLTRIGADERLCCGEHAIAQQWSLAFWEHPANADGLYYRARRDPSRISVALFDRAASSVEVVRDGNLLDDRHQALLADILETYHFDLL